MVAIDDLRRLLLQEWSTGLRITTIPQAMERLGIALNVEGRWRLAQQMEGPWREALLSLEKQEEIADALGREFKEAQQEMWRSQVETWGLASFLLTEREKLAARHILLCHGRGQEHPTPHETAKALRTPLREAQNSFRMLGRLGFISIADGRRPAGYELSAGWDRFTEGLGFSFHTVTLETGERFGVP